MQKIKTEVSVDDNVHVKMEATETSSVSNEPTAGHSKSYTKRSASHLDENPSKKVLDFLLSVYILFSSALFCYNA